jgi:hypothetical protein
MSRSCHFCHDTLVPCHGDSDTSVTASVTVSRIEECHGVTMSRDTFSFVTRAAAWRGGVTSLRFSIYLKDARKELTERNRPVKVNYTGKRKEKE